MLTPEPIQVTLTVVWSRRRAEPATDGEFGSAALNPALAGAQAVILCVASGSYLVQYPMNL